MFLGQREHYLRSKIKLEISNSNEVSEKLNKIWEIRNIANRKGEFNERKEIEEWKSTEVFIKTAGWRSKMQHLKRREKRPLLRNLTSTCQNKNEIDNYAVKISLDVGILPWRSNKKEIKNRLHVGS